MDSCFMTAEEVEATLEKDLEKFKNFWKPTFQLKPKIVEKYEKSQKLIEKVKLVNHEIQVLDSLEKQWIKDSIKDLKKNFNKHEIGLMEKIRRKDAARSELNSLKDINQRELEDQKDVHKILLKLSEQLKRFRIAELEQVAISKNGQMAVGVAKPRSRLKKSPQDHQHQTTSSRTVTAQMAKKKVQQKSITPSPNVIVTRSKSRSKR